MTEIECDEIYNNLRKAWMHTVLLCVCIIAAVWFPYLFFKGEIFTISLSSIITLICAGLPILLWIVFDWIENGINKYISYIRKINMMPQKEKDYDDFDCLGI